MGDYIFSPDGNFMWTGSKWIPRGDIGPDLRSIILGESADVQALGDNYIVMRYRSSNPNHITRVDNGAGVREGWSNWTEPQLAEGWIKRVLAGINPFNQRVKNLFSKDEILKNDELPQNKYLYPSMLRNIEKTNLFKT